MIAYLSGTVQFRGTRFVILAVGGVGYQVFTSLEALKKIPPKGGSFEFFTHLHVRENALELYGFSAMAELEFFEMLIGISGIGPKSALNILSLAPLDTIKRAIGSGDALYLTKVSGIGRRIAEKIILELREKLSSSDGAPVGDDDAHALDALMSLGYTLKEARDALRHVGSHALTLDMKIKEALKILGGARSS